MAEPTAVEAPMSHDERVSHVMAMLQVPSETAISLLQKSEGSVEAAVDAFFNVPGLSRE